YSKNSGSTYTDTISATTSNDGTFQWTMPDDIRPTKDMKVRVSTLPTSDLYAVTAFSSGLFQITGELAMKVPDDTTPIAWAVGSTNNTI
ncbi:hypothetical protein, partial [Listeria monocytogenes]|uniref:hypothetical protein n=1 Tax=Listeria monocytogenes TaxID=1639 RepID=UPI002FDC01B3